MLFVATRKCRSTLRQRMDFYDHTGFEEIQSYYKGDSDKAVRKGISSVTEKEI